MNHEELTKRIETLFPLVHHTQAKHCGYQYFSFKGNEEIVKQVCWAAFGNTKVTRPTAHVSVHLEGNDLIYRISIGLGRAAENFVNGLEEVIKNGTI